MKVTQKNFNKILKQNFIFEKNPIVAVAVSGGPDSMALTFLLKKWIKLKQGKLIALIIDHQIRRESFIESNIISKYLSKNNIKNYIIKVPKSYLNKNTMGEARANRYNSLIDYCIKKKVFHLFLGHHFNDNIETFILRKIAGSNLQGLRSMHYSTINQSIKILRPLIDCTKKQILQFNNQKKIFYVEDSSNNNIKYTRVVIRNFLQKEKKYSKDIKDDFTLVQKYSSLYIKMIYKIFHLLCIRVSNKEIIIDRNKFLKLDVEIQSKIIEIVYKFFSSKNKFLRYSNIYDSLKILNSKISRQVNLAGMSIKSYSFYLTFTK